MEVFTKWSMLTNEDGLKGTCVMLERASQCAKSARARIDKKLEKKEGKREREREREREKRKEDL